jgi:hypothetical protein
LSRFAANGTFELVVVRCLRRASNPNTLTIHYGDRIETTSLVTIATVSATDLTDPCGGDGR